MSEQGGKQATLLVTTLAEYQTRFWIKVAQALIAKNQKVIILSFDDRSCELMDAAGIVNVNIPQRAKHLAKGDFAEKCADVFREFGIERSSFWQSHERLVFEIRDQKALDIKFASYLKALHETFIDLGLTGDNAILVQELGGFLSVFASQFAAAHQKIDNYYLEPAFFKGRLFFLKNNIYAPKIPKISSDIVSKEVMDYLEKAKVKKTIVIPDKDKHHYSATFQKIFNGKNIARLVQKLIDQYVHKKHQEFGYNFLYAKQHAQMLFNSWWLKRHYSPLEGIGEFYYFPFHVPKDVAITIRSPEYYDQLALIDYIARQLPPGVNLAVKEHPAMIGALDARRLIQILRTYDNIKLINPSTNNFNVLEKATAVLTINSKSGAEGLMLRKPTFFFGNAFYEDCPFLTKLKSVSEFPEAIKSIAIPPENVATYFEAVWQQSYPGELYVEQEDNIAVFCETIIKIKA